jgi:hypothetical protein
MEDLKVRAYLAQYLVKVELPVEMSSDTDISVLYKQVEPCYNFRIYDV